MKKAGLLLLGSLIVFSSSCTKENKEGTAGPTSKTPLQILMDGNWNLQSLSHTFKVNDSVVGQEVAQTNSQWAFLPNNTVVSYFYEEPVDTSIYLFSDTIIMIDDLNYNILSFTEQSLIMKNIERQIRPSDNANVEVITEITLDR